MAAIFFYEGNWYDNPPLITGPMHNAFWLGSAVFDGARSFDGFAPDLDRHCARVVQSARKLGMDPPLEAEEVMEICIEAVRRIPKETVAYVRPMFFPTEGDMVFYPESTKFVASVYERSFPEPTGFSACRSSFRRPGRDQAPTDAKAACLYPNSMRVFREASRLGFDNAIVNDPNNNVAEFANCNLWTVKDGLVETPAANGTFLSGITRRRVAKLLRDDGFEVSETILSIDDILDADEVFSTGNLGKVLPCTRIENREYKIGPVFRRARELYFEYAKSTSVF